MNRRQYKKARSKSSSRRIMNVDYANSYPVSVDMNNLSESEKEQFVDIEDVFKDVFGIEE